MGQHGKKFKNASAQGRSREALSDRRGVQARPRDEGRRSSTRASTSPSVWASIPSTPTRWSAARSCCPHGTGKSQRVVVVAKGDKANEARAAGADAVGAEELVEKIQKENWTEFDSMVATPDMMGLVGRLGRVLGPKGLMPNPKVGTVTNDVAKAVRELKAGRVEFRVEKAGIVQARIGKASFGGEKLRDNARTMIETLLRLKPSVGEGDVHAVGDRLHDHGSRHQGRPPAAGRRVRDQVAGNGEIEMERAVKEENIAALKGDLAKATSLVLADFRGITVKNDTALRREFRLNGCKYQVVKNTLLGRAVKGTGMAGLEKLFVGPTAIAYSFEDPAAPAKIATKVAKGEEKFVIKGGYVDGKALDAKGVEALSNDADQGRAASDFPCTSGRRAQNFLALLHGRAAADARGAGCARAAARRRRRRQVAARVSDAIFQF